jgi:N-acetyl-anhydromuramyl-L-alanine amidase AmpD
MTGPKLLYEEIMSPNQSLRHALDVDLFVIHATGGSFESAINTFLRADTPSRVSAHYVISKTGKVVRMVPESKKAWHAGRSIWKGIKDCNDYSIGVELENEDDGLDPYPDEQLNALVSILLFVRALYPKITADRVVGHNMISPGRKLDPNVNFPWVKFGVMCHKAGVF